MTDVDVREFLTGVLEAPEPEGAFDLDRAVAEGDRLRRHGRRTRRVAVIGAAVIVGGAVAAAAIVGRSPYVSVIEPSESMSPTVMVGDSVVIDKRLSPARNDIVLIALPGTDQQTLRRVVGLPGDTVACPDDGAGTCTALVVNGARLSDPALALLAGASFAPVTVRPGQLFVLGDNRSAAVDSTVSGPFQLAGVTGVAVQITTPGQPARPVPGAPAHVLDGNQIDPGGAVPPAATAAPLP